MGTLSSGEEFIPLDKRCLLGANAGVGISLGDDCVVEAGLYVTAGTKVLVAEGDSVSEHKARTFSGFADLLFRRNSTNGAVEVLSRTGKTIALNPDLH